MRLCHRASAWGSRQRGQSRLPESSSEKSSASAPRPGLTWTCRGSLGSEESALKLVAVQRSAVRGACLWSGQVLARLKLGEASQPRPAELDWTVAVPAAAAAEPERSDEVQATNKTQAHPARASSPPRSILAPYRPLPLSARSTSHPFALARHPSTPSLQLSSPTSTPQPTMRCVHGQSCSYQHARRC